jgi:hypothetical protein
MAYETFSPEEVDGIVYRASPKVAPTTPAQSTPMQTAALPSGPVKPSKAKAAEPNVSSLVQNVAEANKGIQESTPAPQAPSAIDALVKDVTDNWKTVLSVAAVPVLGYLANKVLGGKPPEESKGKPIKDRLLVPFERVEPTFSPPTNVGPATQLPGTPQELEKALGPNWEATIAKSDAIRKEKQMLAQERARTSMGEVPTPTAAPAVPASQSPAPVAPNPVAQAAAQTAPVAPPTVAQLAQEAAPAVTTAAQAPAGSIPPATEEKNKGGRPKGAKTATAEERLAKKGGLPGMTKEEAGMRGHLLGMYGGKESPYAQQAYEQVKEILGYTPAYPPNGKGGSLTQEEKGKILDWRKENIEGPKANLTHEMKKTLKGGSAAAIAALALTPAFVNASESQKRQMIGEALLPMGLTPSELESGTLTEKQLRAYQEAQKLGSPYRSVPPR